MRLIQLLKFKKWETRLFKMPCLETPRLETGTRITVASERTQIIQHKGSFVKYVLSTVPSISKVSYEFSC